MTVLALYPQSSTLHLAAGRNDEFETAAWTLTTYPSRLIRQEILPWLSKRGVDNSLQFIVTSGYLPQAAKSGLYILSSNLAKEAMGTGAMLAHYLANELQLPAYLIDPTCPQECYPHALITGTPEFPRGCYGDSFIFKYLSRLEGKGRFIVALLDETVQIGALSGDRLLDLGTSADEGSFAFSQAGGLPFDSLLDLCERVGSKKQLQDKISFSGGFRGYLDGLDFSTLVEDKTLSDSVRLEQIWQAFIYQIAKEIGAYAAVLEGRFDAILLAGALVKNEALIAALTERIDFLGRFALYPGNQGLKALLAGAERIFANEPIVNYQSVKERYPWDFPVL